MKTCTKCGETDQTKFSRGKYHCRPCNNERNRLRDQEAREQNPVGYRFKQYKAAAKRRGLDFELTEFDFQVCLDSPCEYCGDKADGFDRVDSSIGYLYENVTPCCSTCNYMKRQLGVQQFMSKVKRIVSYATQTIVLATCMVLGSFAQGQVPVVVQDNRPDIGITESCPADKADVLVVYSASWCGPCIQMRPKWALLRSQGYKVVYIDIDHPHKYDGKYPYQTAEIVDKAMENRPRVVPTIRYYNSNSAAFLKHELTGTQSLQKVKEALWKPSS